MEHSSEEESWNAIETRPRQKETGHTSRHTSVNLLTHVCMHVFHSIPTTKLSASRNRMLQEPPHRRCSRYQARKHACNIRQGPHRQQGVSSRTNRGKKKKGVAMHPSRSWFVVQQRFAVEMCLEIQMWTSACGEQDSVMECGVLLWLLVEDALRPDLAV